LKGDFMKTSRFMALFLVIACGSSAPAPLANGAKAISKTRLTVLKHSLLGSTGTVSGGGTINCGPSCKADFEAGDAVELTVDDSSQFDSFAIDCPGAHCITSTSSSIEVDMSADHAVTANFRPHTNFVFVTSTTHGANLGGLSGADAICAQRAQAAGLGGQSYVAWLSTDTIAAPSRLGSARGWMRTDGLPVIDSVTELTQRDQFFFPIRLDEKGQDVAAGGDYGFVPVWSGTFVTGTAPGLTCQNWTSEGSTDVTLVGDAAAGALAWSWNNAHYACEGWSLPIYCFETDYATPVSPAPAPASARLAFVSNIANVAFAPRDGGSIADADAVCAADAAQAGLPGSFKALLADIGKSPKSRFDTSKGPWYRLDGVPIVAKAGDLFVHGGPLLLAPLDVTDDLTHAPVMSQAWTGFGGDVDDYSVQGTAATTCNGWSTSSADRLGVASFITFTYKSFRDVPRWPTPDCSQPQQLYCLQE
jgi:hypothetical protein